MSIYKISIISGLLLATVFIFSPIHFNARGPEWREASGKNQVRKDIYQTILKLSKSCEKNNQKACRKIKEIFSTNWTFNSAMKMVPANMAAVCSAGDVEVCLSLAENCGDKPAFCAAEIYRVAAEKGNPEAQYKMGNFYQFGEGVKQDYQQAVMWYAKAVVQNNHPDAQGQLGYLREQGLGIKQDDKKAFNWFMKAAEQGEIKAILTVGRYYQFGQGVARDHQKAISWFRKAVQKNNAIGKYRAHGQYNLGYLYTYGEGVKHDYQQAVSWFQKAAEQNHVGAQNQLGYLFLYGKGIEQDFKKAHFWFLAAASQKNPYAQYYLGEMHFNGYGLKPNQRIAATWYQKSANQNYADAQYRLGNLFEFGNGVEQNNQMAIKWYRQAAMQNHVDAQEATAVMYYLGKGVDEDKEQAAVWFQKAAEQNHVGAAGNLGWYRLTQGKFAQAEKYIVQAHQAEPDSIAWKLNFAHLLYLKGEQKRARKIYIDTLPKLKDQAHFNQTLKADFELFIQKGWQTAALKKELVRLQKRFEQVKGSR